MLANDQPLAPGTPLYTSFGSACDNLIEAFFSGAACHLVRGTVGFIPPTLTQFRFNPEPGFTGTTSFYYASSDQEDCWNQPVCFRESNIYFAKVTVNVGGNAPPTVDAGPSQTVEATGPSGASVTVSGTATDLDGDPLTFAWSGPCGTATSATATFVCPLGLNVVTLEVSDGVNPPVTATTTVIVNDSTPPSIITSPADVVAEATSPAGAVVTYAAATATDAVGPVTIVYSVASGSVFPVGTTPVAVTATDGAANFAQTLFMVTVRDTTPPVLNLPADITLTTSDPGGLAVTYSATAGDIVDTTVSAVCSPYSGSTFRIGTTAVSCFATDYSGNTVTGGFNVTINLLQSHAVAVVLSGNGSGAVTSTPAGINCPGTCSASFTSGTSVTLTAVAAAGSTFVSWDGICAGFGTGPCTFTISGATNVTARFLLTKPVVTQRVNGQHPNPPIVTTSGPMLLTLDVSESAYTAPVSWYWALIVNGQTLWVTSNGFSLTPTPATVAPPTAVAGATLLNVTLPAQTTVTSLLLLVDGTNTLVASDVIVTTRP
jgi:hypothetical protein